MLLLLCFEYAFVAIGIVNNSQFSLALPDTMSNKTSQPQSALENDRYLHSEKSTLEKLHTKMLKPSGNVARICMLFATILWNLAHVCDKHVQLWPKVGYGTASSRYCSVWFLSLLWNEKLSKLLDKIANNFYNYWLYSQWRTWR